MFVGMGANSAGGYNLESSLRFRSSADAYLSRTLTSNSTSSTTMTFSWWQKWGGTNVDGNVASYVYTSNTTDTKWFRVGLTGSANEPQLLVWHRDSSSVQQMNVRTNAVFRDPSAWYHFTITIDTTQATASDRVKIYVNGVQQTSLLSATYPSQNYTFQGVITTSGNAVNIGRSFVNGTAIHPFEGYITEYHHIDGQALTPSDFGETDEDTGVWKPKEYTGTYGTNGFYLNFSDATSTTTLGYDQSSNSNNWTLNNISLTSGTTYDLMNDVPTLTDEDTANFATWNPLDKATLSVVDANLKATNSSGNSWQSIRGTIGVTEGKWYWEAQAVSNTYLRVGVALQTASLTSNYSNPTDSWTYVDINGNKTGNGSETGYGASYTNGDTIGIALDMDAGTLTFYKNGSSQGVAFNTGLSGKEIFPLIAGYGSGKGFIVNFGQRPFAYTPPTGYKKLNTYNLPDSTIKDGSQYMNTVLYTGNGTSQSITGVGFQPDLVWYKQRNTARDNGVEDSVRGAQKILISNATNAEVSASGITSFDSDGFTQGSNVIGNQSGGTYVAWNWRGSDSSAVSNTDGTITSTVSANTDSGFSVVTYVATKVAGATVGHGLGAVPKMIICKNRDGAFSWTTYHESLGATKYLLLDSTAGAGTSSGAWNNTAPSSTVFTLGSAGEQVVGSNQVAYCFAEVEGFSKFGSYTGNGSTDGPFIYTGFKPAFILVKRTDNNGDWIIIDNKRIGYNPETYLLEPNSSDTEYSTDPNYKTDLLSNGFKYRNTAGRLNGSGASFIYMAFAENPFKQSLAR